MTIPQRLCRTLPGLLFLFLLFLLLPLPVRAGDAEALLAHPFRTLEGQDARLAQWRGKVLVVNFWATWCPPCKEEIPAFSRLQEKWRAKGVQFIGIALDTPENVRAFARKTPLAYPSWLGDGRALMLTRDLGNVAQGLPFTLLLDATGKPLAQKTGLLPEVELDAWLQGRDQESGIRNQKKQTMRIPVTDYEGRAAPALSPDP
ncbi:MAG: TlpA family protein disulfide reductase [Zoogloeaceae bacterium]|jgi:thiol-disulfide isomerase/thioredoxin|nr:TlpA family protein disulfide reductase [Zoogloeaceae bacterium]